MSEQQEKDSFKASTEKIWDATRKTFHVASFRANQYKRIVQKKIDAASTHKKIAAAHAELGKLVDELREEGETDLINRPEVQALLQKLDTLKLSAAALEEEIEGIKNESPPEEEPEKPE